jgi:methionyl-tRNA formyltransferase
LKDSLPNVPPPNSPDGKIDGSGRNAKFCGPGRVIDDTLAVACGGSTAIRLLELQRPGGNPLPAKAFLNGYKIKRGEVLG